jgi:AcrR family transcriptional regulator
VQPQDRRHHGLKVALAQICSECNNLRVKTESMGLRERKRVQTRRRLEEAAIGLALRDGLEKVTVDAISERADVSPRTFFNYFDSKEDAVLGVRPPDINEQTLAEHRASYDGAELVESVVGLLIMVVGPSIDEPTFRKARMEVLRQQPQLLERLMSRMARITEQLTEAVGLLLAQHDAATGARASSDVDAVAETLLVTCAGGIRAATKQWAATDSDISLDELEQRAVSLVREAIEKLT